MKKKLGYVSILVVAFSVFGTAYSHSGEMNVHSDDGSSAVGQSSVSPITASPIPPRKCDEYQAEKQVAIGPIDGDEGTALAVDVLSQVPGDAFPKVHSTIASEKQALDIVKSHFGDMLADCIDKAEVVRDGNYYVVTVPSKHREVPPGHLRYGPSYAVRAVLDAESGQLVEGRIGR